MIDAGAPLWFSIIATLLWTALILWCLRVPDKVAVPPATRDAFYLGILAACIGGIATGLGYLGALDAPATRAIGAGWRAGLIVAGLYGLFGMALASRARKRRR